MESCYKQLDILDRIKEKKQKMNEFWLKRIEKKEIERAESNAVLAAHYLKLKKYYKDGKFDKYMKNLIIDTTDTNNIEISSINKRISQPPQSSKKHENQSEIENDEENPHKKKKLGFRRNMEMLLNMKKDLPQREEREINITGKILEDYPNLNEELQKNRFKPEKMWTFEEKVEQHMRKMKSDSLKNEHNKILSVEEKMIRYAQEFKENAKKREALINKIDTSIPEIKKNTEDFFEWERINLELRHDQEHCRKRYVNLLREGKI